MVAAALRSAALATGLALLARADVPAPEDSALAADGECDASEEQCGLSALQRHVSKHQVDPEVTVADAYGQCGGEGWAGATACSQGYECQSKDQWYSQCAPEGLAIAGKVDENDDVQDDEEKGPKKTGMDLLTPNPPMPEPPRVEHVNPVVIKGNFLYDSVTGKRFFAKGTSYNPRMDSFKPGRSNGKMCESGNAQHKSYTVDVISDVAEDRWSEDLKVIANLGANTIRLFNIDAGQDHSKFMKAAESLGIYVIFPLNSKDNGFLPAFPSPDCYNLNMTFPVKNADGTTHPYGNVGTNVLTYAKQIVKQFSKFSNTLFFTVNNEFAMNNKDGFAGFQCVKALTRDIHLYQKACGASMRRVPLIYSDYDMGAPDRGIIAQYLTCALESEDDAIDAYGLNVYSYCNKAYPGDGKKDNFNYSPYKDIKKDFKDFSVPVLFTEFGCPDGDFSSSCPYKGGRTWPDVKLFFNDVLGEILSGAIAYTYEQDFEERGMVLTPGFLKDQPNLYMLDNYYALQKQFQTHNVSSKWDGAVTTDCSWTPDKAAKQQDKHLQPQCPSSSTGKSLQKRRRTSKVTDWHELPATAHAPLSEINGQAECPVDEVDPALAKEGQCHFA